MPGDIDNAPIANAIVATIREPLLVLDADLTVHTANPAFLRHFRVSEAETEGQPVFALGNGQWDIPELRRLFEQVLAENRLVEDYLVEHDFESLGRRIMRLNACRLRVEGRPEFILLAIVDDTERMQLMFDLEGEKEFADKLVDSVRESLLILGWDLRVHSANLSFYQHFRVRPDEIVGKTVYKLGNGQWDIPELRRLLEDVLPNETTFDDYFVEHEFESIGRRVMLLNGRRLDHTNLILLAIRDITDQREAEIRQGALMGELQHRVKNILNNVRALALQTRRHNADFDSFFEAFEARLGALARAQDLLVRGQTRAVPLRDIVELELHAVGAAEPGDFTARGPEVFLAPHDARAFAMTIHELTTNAAKYGALAKAGGRIAITWDSVPADDGEALAFTWRESGVMIADTRPHRGFGSRVIEESLPHMLGGTAELRFRPDGVECQFDIPLRSPNAAPEFAP